MVVKDIRQLGYDKKPTGMSSTNKDEEFSKEVIHQLAIGIFSIMSNSSLPKSNSEKEVPLWKKK